MKKKIQKKTGTTIIKIVNKILYVWLIIVAFIFIVGLVSSGDIKGAFTFLLFGGVLPFLVVKGLTKLFKK